MMLQPAYVQKGKDRPRAKFPGVREELVEFVIFKLAVQSGCFTYDTDSEPKSDNFTLFTTLYQIHEELKNHGRAEPKSKTYSYDQIKEALEVLAKTTVHLTTDDQEDMIFSPIADFGFFGKGRSPDELPRTGTVYIRFNSLISKSILSRKWRQIDYDSVMQSQTFLVRWLRKTLSLRFTYAAPTTSFNLKLSTLIENSGISAYGRLSDNLKYVETALSEMPDVVARYTIERKFAPNPSNGKGRYLVDAKITIFPAESFVENQVVANAQHARIEGAGKTATGDIVLEPKKETAQSFKTYMAQRQKWLDANTLDEPASDT